MARCDAESARAVGVNCADFYQRQARVASQTGALRIRLRSLGVVLRTGRRPSGQDQATAARFDRYMGSETARDHNKVALAHNVLLNAERQLRSMAARAAFRPGLGSGGNTEPGAMLFGSRLDDNTILHEAIHYGTAVWRSDGNVPFIPDQGNIGSYNSYGTLAATLERGRRGWRYTVRSAASYAWLVTGP
jgi:hypothetical protein